MPIIPWTDLVKDLVLIFMLGIPIYLYVYGSFISKGKKALGILLGILVFTVHFISSFISFLSVQFVPFVAILIFIWIAKKHRFISQRSHPTGFDYEVVKWRLELMDVVLGILMGIGMQLLSLIVSATFKSILDYYKVSAPPQPIMKYVFALEGWRLVFFVFMAVIMAPVVEEFILRMWLYDKVLKPRMSVGLAMLISALIFSILHFNLLSFPAIILIGLINCMLYDRKGYWWPVFLHMGFNSVSTFIMLIVKYLQEAGIFQNLENFTQ